MALPTANSSTDARVAAIFLTIGMALCGLFLPWSRLPDGARIVLPLLFYVDVALLRHGEGGAPSGLAPLVLLPVVWLALYGSRVQLTAALVLVVATLAGPIVLIGGSLYPTSEWRRAILYLMIAPMIGFVIQGLVEKSRAQARTMRIVATAMRELPSDSDVRHGICNAVLDIGAADYCVLVEPDAENRLVSSAQAGFELDRLILTLSDETSRAIVTFKSGIGRFVADAVGDPHVSRRLLEATGAASVLYEPVVRGDECVGVLCVAWRRRVRSLRRSALEGVALLAAEAGVAIERSDLIERMTELARTDALTGLANRRSWDEALGFEQERARRTEEPMCAVLIDLDHFKVFNDRFGHQAGDLMLKEASAAWRAQLRDVDTLARWGGEEFALLLPACPLVQAKGVLERLKLATPEGVTFSAGIVRWDEHESALQLMRRADAGLYSAKQSGRDRVTI
jgi:diguanylate cyclase (GGDEF)-like protein